MVTEGRKYLNKPAALSCWVVLRRKLIYFTEAFLEFLSKFRDRRQTSLLAGRKFERIKFYLTDIIRRPMALYHDFRGDRS